MLRVKQVAERLNVSCSKVYELLGSGRLPHYRIDGSVRVSEEQLQEYLESCKKGRRFADSWPKKTDPRTPKTVRRAGQWF